MPNSYNPVIFDNQHWLIDKICSFGYKESHKGVCHGVSCMAMQAILAGDLKRFDQRLFLIHKTKRLHRTFNRIKAEKLKNPGRLAKESVYEVWPFMDGVHFSQHPYTHLIDPKQDSLLQTTDLLTSNKLAEEGGIKKVDTLTGIYTIQDLCDYLKSWRNILISQRIKTPIVLLLSSADHVIAVSYDAVLKTWILVDANALPSRRFNSDAEMAKDVIDSFNFKDDSDPVVALCTSAFTTHRHRTQANYCIHKWHAANEFKKIHTVTQQKAVLRDSERYTTWLDIAAKFGDTNIVAELILHGAHVNYDRKSKIPPLYTAAEFGHKEIVALLLQNGADPNFKCKSGETPQSIALLFGHTEVAARIKKASKTQKSHLQGGSFFASAKTRLEQLVAQIFSPHKP